MNTHAAIDTAADLHSSRAHAPDPLATGDVLSRIEVRADAIAAEGPRSEELGRLTDTAAALLRETGVMRMLAPTSHHGYASHPSDWARAVMRLASLDGATGWIAGIVGVHPWELALMPPAIRDLVWGHPDAPTAHAHPDVWVGSPYAPMGTLTPISAPDTGEETGEYSFNGHWQFSSGTDHCDWLFLGALATDPHGRPHLDPPQLIHALIPRRDYTIVEDSWDVVGLQGTGSKDITVTDAVIPAAHTLRYDHLVNGTAQAAEHVTDLVHQMPFSAMFSLGITSAVIGIAEGGLRHHLTAQAARTHITGKSAANDPYAMPAIAAAAADIEASRASLLASIDRIYDDVAAGHRHTFDERVQHRNIQVAAAWRAVRALDDIVARAGGNGMRRHHPLQRFWRDAHMGLTHAIHVPGPVQHAAALASIDAPVPGHLRVMI